MKFNIIQNLKQCALLLRKQEPNIAKKIAGCEYSGELESLRGSLKLQQNLSNVSDGWTTYFINKDGSGRKITAWGEKKYSKGTLSSILDSAIKMRQKNDKMVLTNKNIEQLIEDFESKIASLDDKK